MCALVSCSDLGRKPNLPLFSFFVISGHGASPSHRDQGRGCPAPEVLRSALTPRVPGDCFLGSSHQHCEAVVYNQLQIMRSAGRFLVLRSSRGAEDLTALGWFRSEGGGCSESLSLPVLGVLPVPGPSVAVERRSYRLHQTERAQGCKCNL